MTNRKNFLLSILLLVGVVVLNGCQIIPKQATPKQVTQVNNADLEQRYVSDVTAILKPYWQNHAIDGIKDKILNLTVPSKYLDVHLTLVTAFELLEQGQRNNDAAKTKLGQEKIDHLKATNPWLQ